MKKFWVVLAVAVAALSAVTALGVHALRTTHASPTVYVALGGSDAASGNRSAPYATLQHAVDTVSGGGTVVVRGGTYSQRVVLKAVHHVVIQPAEGEHVVLDGSSVRVPDGRSAMVEISDSTDVSVRGMDITGYTTSRIHAVPIGIYVHGSDERIDIRGNRVHHLGNHNGTLGSMAMNAHGIAVYGDSPTGAVRGLVIDHNEVDHLTLGASETVVVNGNVDHWRITNNRIHDDNNIGIDAIGYEETLPAKSRYTDLNRARDGYIGSNVVENILSKGNPAYYSDGEWCDCADGIYVDGGTRITIDHNTVRHNDIGIEVAAENARGAADHVTVAYNLISRSGYTGISTGGYCDGAQDCGGVQTGRSFDNRFTNNLFQGDNGSSQFLVQYHENRNRITANSFCMTGAHAHSVDTVARSDSGSKDVVDFNTYSTPDGVTAGTQWGWAGKTYSGWNPYRHASGLDAHSRFTAKCLAPHGISGNPR
ncbi:hypothetical protein ACWC4D_29950 [Streptomyces sp. NPDC001288]|uniref:hypothetical protein n=1 Tax=Streptomyces sp. NPDC001297 TaxID=3364559 RepID=UPI0036BAFAED